ncbi:hypothetical protein [Escherichia coli]|uniref:hypothetical protein n=1 Tax=Escherichia coli TaxID=562 RepID=UPI002022FE5A|nr:hypothetical protein [Escherichia coli]
MKKAVINVDKTNPLPVLTDSVTRVSIQCTAKDENGAGIEVNILDLIQDHDTAEVKVQFGSSPVQALAMLRRVMTALEKQANAETEYKPLFAYAVIYSGNFIHAASDLSIAGETSG